MKQPILTLLLSLAITFGSVSAISRNQSFSEYGIIFDFNTILLEYDIKTKTGTPVFQGEFFIQGTNDTVENGDSLERVMPHWTKENVLRICF